MRLFLIAALIGLTLPLQAFALELAGRKTIRLVDAQGNDVIIGSIDFAPTPSGTSYKIALSEAEFGDYFLSMRPFRCLAGPDKHWCHVPYPYENRHEVSDTNLTDLEYDFLFVWKGATDYGINMWNGVYYKLEIEQDRIVGRLHEMNMDILAVPPDAGELRPIQPGDLEDGDPDSHWLPLLVIE